MPAPPIVGYWRDFRVYGQQRGPHRAEMHTLSGVQPGSIYSAYQLKNMWVLSKNHYIVSISSSNYGERKASGYRLR